MIEVSSVVLFASDLTDTAAFYRAVGVPLVDEDHDGELHAATEVGPVHVAVYQAEAGVGAQAPAWRSAASDFVGFYVDSLDEVRDALTALGAPLLTDHQVRPWGCRFVAEDPDGRPVEINQHDHCR